VPGGFDFRAGYSETLRDWNDDVGFGDIGLLGEERARCVVIERGDCVVAALRAYEFGRLEGEARVDVPLRRVDWEPDLRGEML
jgi:hypothetical protein